LQTQVATRAATPLATRKPKPRTIEQYWQQWQQQPANPSSNISANNSKNMHILVYLLEGKTYIEVVRFN